MSEAKLLLYSRLYCPLCEEMLGAVRNLQPEFGFQLEVVDIDERQELRALYNTEVPVLCGADGVEICRYHFDLAAFRHYFGHPTD